MTEASENAYLVRVRAQVMSRDEGTGGWIALGGGGLAHVMVGRRPHPNPDEPCNKSPGSGDGAPLEPPLLPYEYYIHGRRISDNVVVLECTIREDFQYNKVMPTFHHWITNDRRFGLTFQTAADARAFDKGVRTCVDELLAGWGGAWPSAHCYSYLGSKDEDDESNIFECLNLPSESRSSSENSTADRAHLPRRPHELTQTPILSAINLPTHAHEPSLKTLSGHDDRYDDQDSDRCPYVHLTAVHEYTYPGVGVGVGGGGPEERSPPNTKPPMLTRGSGSLKKAYSGPPPLPEKKPTDTFQARLKCRHCHEWYLESANRAGSCEYAPDCCRSCIHCCSCLKCAQCMVYHCMADAEGDFGAHPCDCAPRDAACAKRWLGLTLLSILVPCLCCYLPLRAAHRAARAAHLAGGLHAPLRPQAPPAAPAPAPAPAPAATRAHK